MSSGLQCFHGDNGQKGQTKAKANKECMSHVDVTNPQVDRGDWWVGFYLLMKTSSTFSHKKWFNWGPWPTFKGWGVMICIKPKQKWGSLLEITSLKLQNRKRLSQRSMKVEKKKIPAPSHIVLNNHRKWGENGEGTWYGWMRKGYKIYGSYS